MLRRLTTWDRRPTLGATHHAHEGSRSSSPGSTAGGSRAGARTPADSLNVAITDAAPSVGTTDDGVWAAGTLNVDFDGWWALDHHSMPAVQFKAGNAS